MFRQKRKHCRQQFLYSHIHQIHAPEWTDSRRTDSIDIVYSDTFTEGACADNSILNSLINVESPHSQLQDDPFDQFIERDKTIFMLPQVLGDGLVAAEVGAVKQLDKF